MSAATSVRRPAGSLGTGWLETMAKPGRPSGEIGCAVTRSTWASGGASRTSAARKSCTPAAGPSTSANTPSASLPTQPARPSLVAREYTNGRNPTPWTTPSTRTDARTLPVTGPSVPGFLARLQQAGLLRAVRRRWRSEK